MFLVTLFVTYYDFTNLCYIFVVIDQNLVFTMSVVYPYLSKEVLDGFKYKYKYSSKDTSPFSCYVMHPFWDKLVLLYPMWVAPNLLTFLGFLSLVVQIMIIAFFDPYFNAAESDSIPTWVWLFSAIAVFCAHQLDGTDGKQARRTQSSGPLGELFDHGIDSLSTFFLPLGLFSLFGHGTYGQTPVVFLLALYTIQLPFVIAQWEKYLTGVLYLPWGYDIGMSGVAITYFVSWLGNGTPFWRRYVYEDYTMSTILVLACFLSLVFSTVVSLYNILDSYWTKSGKMLGLYEALLPIFSSSVLMTVVTYWAFNSPSNILVVHERWFLTMQGFIFSNIATRLIVSHMSLTRAQPVNLFVALLVLGVAILFTGTYIFGSQNPMVLNYEYYFLIGFCTFVVIGHLHYGCCIVIQMAEHLGISVFKIKSKK